MKMHFAVCAFALLLATTPTFAAGIDEAKVGLELAEMGLDDLAASQFEAALKTKDLSPEEREKTLYNLGTLHLETGRPDLALKSFDEALRISPREARTLVNRAEALRMMRRHDEALKNLDQAIRIDNGLADAHYARGLNLLSKDQAGEAEAAFNAALGEKSRPQYKIGLARSLQAQKRYKDALALLDDVIDDNPRLAQAYLYRSAAYHGLGEKRKAGDDLTAAFKLAPNDPMIRAYYDQRRYGKRAVVYKTTAETSALAAPHTGAPVYTKLSKGILIDAPVCDKKGWCRVMFGRTLVGYVKKAALTIVSSDKKL